MPKANADESMRVVRRASPLRVARWWLPASSGQGSPVSRANSAPDHEIAGAVASSTRFNLPSDRCPSHCTPCFRASARPLLAELSRPQSNVRLQCVRCGQPWRWPRASAFSVAETPGVAPRPTADGRNEALARQSASDGTWDRAATKLAPAVAAGCFAKRRSGIGYSGFSAMAVPLSARMAKCRSNQG